jgi:hypothetical protein
MLAPVRTSGYLEFVGGGDLSLAGPKRGEATIERRGQTIEVALFCLQRANLGSQPRHHPKSDDLVAFHAGRLPVAWALATT